MTLVASLVVGKLSHMWAAANQSVEDNFEGFLYTGMPVSVAILLAAFFLRAIRGRDRSQKKVQKKTPGIGLRWCLDSPWILLEVENATRADAEFAINARMGYVYSAFVGDLVRRKFRLQWTRSLSDLVAIRAGETSQARIMNLTVQDGEFRRFEIHAARAPRQNTEEVLAGSWGGRTPFPDCLATINLTVSGSPGQLLAEKTLELRTEGRWFLIADGDGWSMRLAPYREDSPPQLDGGPHP